MFVKVRAASFRAHPSSLGTRRGYRTVPMPRPSGSWTYRAHGPSTEPGNSSTSVLVHSGGLSQLDRSSSSCLAAAAIAADWSAVGVGKGKVSKHVVGV